MISRTYDFAFLAVLSLSVSVATAAQAQYVGSVDEKSVIESYNKTGFNLFLTRKSKPGNVLLSPFSIGTAMSMTYAGARGSTRIEMAKALNLNATGDNINVANNAIANKLTSTAKKGGGSLDIANGLCLTSRPEMVQKTFRRLMTANYNAEVFNGTSVTPINAWVSKKTNGKIDSILTQLTANSVCVLLNAISFKGVWVTPFDKTLTRNEPFGSTKSDSVTARMMRITTKMPFFRGEGFSAVSVPYNSGFQSMVILLPEKRDGLASLESSLTFEKLQSLIYSLSIERQQKVALSLPKFKMASGQDLIPPFKSLGMHLAFSQTKSDFSGISGHQNQLGELYLSQIKHQATIETDEAGSVATAATAVEMATRGVSITTPFHADHPFLFCITDKSTGAILFMGRMANPQEKSTAISK